MRGEPPIRFPWRRSLRTRLTLLFAALGLIPAVIVGYAVLRNLTQGIDVWENPGVTATMESVRQVARTSVDKLVSNLTIHAQHAIEATNLRNEVRDASSPRSRPSRRRASWTSSRSTSATTARGGRASSSATTL